MWTLGIYEDTKVLKLTPSSISAMAMLLHSFLDPATASQAPYRPLLFIIFFSASMVLASLLNLRRIEGRDASEGPKLEEDDPRTAQFAEVARTVIFVPVRNSVDLKCARKGPWFLCQERAPSQELQSAA